MPQCRSNATGGLHTAAALGVVCADVLDVGRRHDDFDV